MPEGMFGRDWFQTARPVFDGSQTPSPNGEHEDFAPENQRIDFFSSDSAEFLPGTIQFDAALARLVSNMVQKLQRLRNSKVAIYVADAASDMTLDRRRYRTSWRRTATTSGWCLARSRVDGS